MKEFADIYVQNGENPVFCYRSGNMVYEESLYKGALVSCGWNSAGYPLNVLERDATRIKPDVIAESTAFRLEIDGLCMDYDWKLEGFECKKTDCGVEGILSLLSDVRSVCVRLHTVLDGTQTFSRWFEIENRTDNHLCINKIHLMSGVFQSMDLKELDVLPDPEQRYDLGWFEGDHWGTEGEFQWHPAHPGVQSIDTRFRRDRHRFPALMIRNNVMGTILYMQMDWSGGCRFTVDYDARALCSESILSFSAEIGGYSPLLILRPGEKFVMPQVEVGLVSGNLDDSVNDMHNHVRRSVLNRPEADGSSCLVGGGMGADHDMMMESTEIFMRQLRRMGAEVFIIDAGWFCPPADSIDWYGCNGRNHPDPERYPENGLCHLRELCHSIGMKFGLWVEIERLGENAPVYSRHPEWRAEDRFGSREKGFLDLTIPEAAEWAENELARMIAEYGMDLLRVDYNVFYGNYFSMRDTCNCGMKECISLRQFKAAYDMFASLKKRFPNVIFENCAGGGGRMDLGQMRSFHHTWVSDWQKPPRSVLITNGTTMVLPPEKVDRLFGGMGCHKAGTLAFHMRNVMFGHMSLNVIAPMDALVNEEAMEFVRHSVDLYKSFIRPILPSARIFHHTPDTKECRENGFCVIEIATPDCSCGVIGAFTLASAGENTNLLIPRGVDPSKRYTVTLDNSGSSYECRGADLMRNGLRLVMPGALTSELILYQEID